MTSIKCAVVGNGGVGKTSMLISYVTGTFQTCFMPTIYDREVKEITVDDEPIELELIDTAGQEDYDRLRPLSYPGVNVFLICFSLNSPMSLDGVVTKWVPELTQHCPLVPIILVGMKNDLRDQNTHDPNENPRIYEVMPEERGATVAEEIGAISYLECSAITKDNLEQLFENAARAGLVFKNTVVPKKKKFCTLM